MTPHTETDRIRIEASTVHVRVMLDGELLADSTRPLALHETGYPVRWYLPPDDVRTDLLRKSETQTFCPYKGNATHWSSKGADDVAWSYQEARELAHEVEGHFAFYPDRVDLQVDD